MPTAAAAAAAKATRHGEDSYMQTCGTRERNSQREGREKGAVTAVTAAVAAVAAQERRGCLVLLTMRIPSSVSIIAIAAVKSEGSSRIK